LGPIRSPPLKTVYFLPNPPLRYLYIFSPNLWDLSRFCLFSISISLSQKNAPKRGVCLGISIYYDKIFIY
jgi:hypothetical protein